MSVTVSIKVGLDNATNSDDQSKQDEVKPTDDECGTLQHISDRFPLTSWLIILGQLSDGFAYFGIAQIMQNYIQFPERTLGDEQPGALGRGQKMATLITAMAVLFTNLTPILAAIIADQFWGKYKTLFVTGFIYLAGLIILVVTSIPMSIDAGVAMPGLIVALIFIGLGEGAMRSIAPSLMAEQYRRKKPVIEEIDGKKKIIDPKITIESLFGWLYWARNCGGFLGVLILTNVEKYYSFWLAYFIALIAFPSFIIVLLVDRHEYVRVPPTGSLFVRAIRVIFTAIRNRWQKGKDANNKHILDYAKKEILPDKGSAILIESENQFIDDLKQVIYTCRVFCFFPVYWVCYNQSIGNFTSQAAQMNVGPVPNDVLGNINPLIVVIFIPIFDKLIYPTLRRFHMKFNSIPRITAGFLMAALGMAWTAIVQYLIYSTGPNYNYTTKPCSTCQEFNNISVIWQIPSYFLVAISEILAAITGLEYAYSNAPSSMKSVIMALYLFAAAFGCVLNLVLLPVTVNPNLLWMYASLAIITFIIGIIFYIVFRNHDT